MSNFDPKSPSYVPPGATVVNDGSTFTLREANQTAETILAASTLLTASTAVTINNIGCRGGLFILDVTELPASASTTIALKINLVDPVGLRTATLASRAAISTTGQAILMVYPGVSASAGGVAQVLPRTFSTKLSISSAATNKSCILSLSMLRIL